jgi:hypothetical protein
MPMTTITAVLAVATQERQAVLLADADIAHGQIADSCFQLGVRTAGPLRARIVGTVVSASTCDRPRRM